MLGTQRSRQVRAVHGSKSTRHKYAKHKHLETTQQFGYPELQNSCSRGFVDDMLLAELTQPLLPDRAPPVQQRHCTRTLLVRDIGGHGTTSRTRLLRHTSGSLLDPRRCQAASATQLREAAPHLKQTLEGSVWHHTNADSAVPTRRSCQSRSKTAAMTSAMAVQAITCTQNKRT